MTKDILRNYRSLLLEEKQLQEELKFWETKAVATSGNYDGMPRGSDISDPTARYAIMITEIKELLKEKHKEIILELKGIEDAINCLRPQYRFILREYYIKDKNWAQIAVKMNYSIHHIWRLHGEALKQLKT